MKIGILTFHFGINYGGVLQCYALQQYLTKMGHSVQVINFNPTNNNGMKYNLFKRLKKNLKGKIKYINNIGTHPLLYCYSVIQKQKFADFLSNKLHLTHAYHFDHLKNISNEFDAIIVGSDQVWNKSQHSHGTYFLAPFKSFKGLRICYSPCCALNIFEKDNQKLLANSLLEFDSISVRNIETFEFVKNITGIEAPTAIDPVMLFEFKEIIHKKFHIAEEYILVYILGSEIDGGHAKTTAEIKRKNRKLPVYSIILTENRPKMFAWSDKTFWYTSVEQWLNLFYNASFIYTDSFHGVLFALKFGKKFLAYYKDKSRSSRFIDLIKRYNLGDNIVDSYKSAIEKNSFVGNVDYKNIMPLINKDIDDSKDFLSKALANRKM